MANILIATPQEAVRRQFEQILDSDAYTFILCADGASVRREIARDLPDLILTDVDLPGLDVFDLVQALQEAAKGGRIPSILARSDFLEDAERVESESLGFSWMGLAVGPDDLRRMVRAKLSSGGGGAVRGTILVVDDDWSIRELLAKRLRMEGYEVIAALDGEEGLRMLEQNPELVLMDVAMPKLDGFGMLEQMQSEARYQEIPVIVMTAHAQSSSEASRGLKLGASDYVRKPFEWNELLARIQTQLRIREAHRMAAEKQRDSAIIELAGAAAHEINNPLSVVMGRLELLSSHLEGSEPFYRDLEEIGRLLQRIAEVVEKMGHVRRYQVQNYCNGVNILDLNRASAPDETPPER